MRESSKMATQFTTDHPVPVWKGAPTRFKADFLRGRPFARQPRLGAAGRKGLKRRARCDVWALVAQACELWELWEEWEL